MNSALMTGASWRTGKATLYLLPAIALFLIAMTQPTHARQSASAPQGPSQNSCQQIAVFGAVRKPSRVGAPQRLRLLEVLGKVGGPNERAGKTVQIVHSCNCSPCDKHVDEYNLVDVLRGREEENPYVVPGDIVMVPEADSIFVIGNVWKQDALTFVPGMTVTRAIALVGGLGKNSGLVTVRIHRDSSQGPPQGPIVVNVKAIIRGSAEDVSLRPWDVVEVSDELGHFQSRKLSPPICDPPLLPRKDNSGS